MLLKTVPIHEILWKLQLNSLLCVCKKEEISDSDLIGGFHDTPGESKELAEDKFIPSSIRLFYQSQNFFTV